MKVHVKKVIGLLLYLIYCLLSLVFIKKKKRLVFISFPDATDNSWYLYKYALNNVSDYEIVWLVSELTCKNKILNEAVGSTLSVKVIERWSFLGFLNFVNSRFVFFTHGTYFFIGRALNVPTLVNLWHGMPIKAIGLLDNDRSNTEVCYSDYVIATSDFYKGVMSEAFGKPLEAVMETGMPRNDVLHQGISKNSRCSIYSKLNIALDQKIIVWLPTYRVSNIGDIRIDSSNTSFIDDLSDDFVERLNQECIKNNTFVIIKLHPMDSCVAVGEAFNFSNILFYPSGSWNNLEVELYDLISISMGVVSDFSSVMLDCLSASIPVGFIEESQSAYLRRTVTPIGELMNSVCLIKEPNDIIKLLFSHVKFNKKNIYESKIFSSYSNNASEKILKKLHVI